MLYLYDPRYNLKTETTYEKMCRLFVKTKGTIVAKDAITGEVIGFFRSTRDAEKHLYVVDKQYQIALRRSGKQI